MEALTAFTVGTYLLTLAVPETGPIFAFDRGATKLGASLQKSAALARLILFSAVVVLNLLNPTEAALSWRFSTSLLLTTNILSLVGCALYYSTCY